MRERITLIVGFFFFSSRRRHTIWNCDWSSDVCSSDLHLRSHPGLAEIDLGRDAGGAKLRSEERREGKSVDLGGRRIIKKKKKKKTRKAEKKKKRIKKKKRKNKKRKKK